MSIDHQDSQYTRSGKVQDSGSIILTNDFSFTILKYTQYIFIYKNHDNLNNFLTDSILRDSLEYLVTTHYPPLAGWFESTKDNMSIVWSKDDRNMPEFTSASSSMDFAQLLHESEIRNDILVPNTPTGNIFKGKSRIPLFLAKVTRLEDNSAIALCISYHHVLMDGSSICTFMRNWGYVCNQMVEHIPYSEIKVLRTPIFKSLELDKHTCPKSDCVGDKEYICAPRTWRSNFTSPPGRPNVEHRLFVSPQQRDNIRCRAHSVGVTFNSLLCAIVWKEISRLRLLYRPEIECDPACLGMLCNIRRCFGAPETHCLNAIFNVYNDDYSVKDIANMNLEDVAAIINSVVKKNTAEYLVNAFCNAKKLYIESGCDFRDSDANNVVLPRIATSSPFSRMYVSSNIHYPIYKADFGFGAPEYVRPSLVLLDGFLRIFPGPPTRTGDRYLDIYLTLDNEVDITKSHVLSEFMQL